jgi:hypothetical protein
MRLFYSMVIVDKSFSVGSTTIYTADWVVEGKGEVVARHENLVQRCGDRAKAHCRKTSKLRVSDRLVKGVLDGWGWTLLTV